MLICLFVMLCNIHLFGINVAFLKTNIIPKQIYEMSVIYGETSYIQIHWITTNPRSQNIPFGCDSSYCNAIKYLLSLK